MDNLVIRNYLMVQRVESSQEQLDVVVLHVDFCSVFLHAFHLGFGLETKQVNQVNKLLMVQIASIIIINEFEEIIKWL